MNIFENMQPAFTKGIYTQRKLKNRIIKLKRKRN